MKDLMGNTLSVGDTVAVTYYNCSTMQIGKIVRFTPKMIEVRYREYGSPAVRLFPEYQVLLAPNQP